MITKAIIPAAGLGTRMLSLTHSTPKELLPIAGVPMIHHAVQEAVDAGIDEIYIVIRRGKEAISDYLTSLSNIPADLSFIYQERPLGLGDALYCAKDHIGDSPFLMLIPDQLLFSAIPASRQLTDNYNFHKPTILSSMVKIPSSETRYFQGARGFQYQETPPSLADCRGRPCACPELLKVDSLLPEEEVNRTYQNTPYQLRGFGRTIFPPQIFQYLTHEFINPQTGEVDLLKTFQALHGRLQHYAIILDGRPCDFGTLKGYLFYTSKPIDL